MVSGKVNCFCFSIQAYGGNSHWQLFYEKNVLKTLKSQKNYLKSNQIPWKNISEGVFPVKLLASGMQLLQEMNSFMGIFSRILHRS